AGETWTYTVSRTILATDPSPLVNTATTSGTDGDGETITDADDHSLDIGYAPVLLAAKTGPATGNVGDLITYTITVQHDPSSDNSPVLMTGVTDNLAGAATFIDDGTGDNDLYLDAGEVWTYQVSRTILPTDPSPLVNTATASGTDGDGETITDADDHTMIIDFAPQLIIDKTGPPYAIVGETVTYIFTVTNDNLTGDGSPIYNVIVTDNIAGVATYQSGDDSDNALEVGETWLYTATYTVQWGDPQSLINTVTVTGTDGNNDAAGQDTDTHTMEITFLPPIANDDNSTGNTPGVNATLNLLTNDDLGDGSPATVGTTTVDLDPLTAGVQLTYTVAGEGTWTYDPLTGELTFNPDAGFTSDPTPITYVLTETLTGLTDDAVVTVTYTEVPPVANNDSDLGNVPGTDVTINVLANDLLSDGSPATVGTTTVDLDPLT
ncbi:MAG TPA: hypothetical protein PK711_12885, partial [Bacteroidales bacterium]|nr:hypothetical protein [Bacteroidales bacterium]